MKKILIEGKNGTIEASSKYIYLIIKNEDSSFTHEHIIWFEEIEDIVYKKPTRDRYGFITIYLSTKSSITKEKKKYTIILDKIDQKSLEGYKKIFDLIRSIVANKEIKVKEVIVEEKDEKEEIIKEKEEPNEQIPVKEEVKVSIVINNQEKKKEKEIIKQDNKEYSEVIPKIEEDISIKNIEQIIDKKVKKDSSVDVITDFSKEETEEEKKVKIINIPNKEIENESTIEEELNEEEQEDKKEVEVIEKNEKIKSIDSMQEKIKNLEKQLQEITYKEIIINRHLEEANDRKKIDKLVIELKKLIEKLEKVRKEILKQEKTLNENDYIRLQDGNVVITSISKVLLNDNKNDIESYLTLYQESTKKIDEIQKETDYLSKEVDSKKKDIKMSDEEYDIEINRFRSVKSNKEIIKDYIRKSKEDLSKVKWKIERTIEPHIKYKYVKRGISAQTKRLAALQALNTLRPHRSRLSTIALSLFTGVSSISDLLGYDIKKDQYNEIIQKEYLIGLESVDTEKARIMIDSSKDQIDKILYECEKKYSNYPKFKELQKQLLSLKKDIEKEDKELTAIEEKVYDYKKGPMMKTLRFNQE